jgi:hypothetical protein
MVWIGVFPGYFLNKIGPGIDKYTSELKKSDVKAEVIIPTEEAQNK